MKGRTMGLAVAAALIAPAAASASSLRIEGFYGAERPPTIAFNGTGSASDLYKNSLQVGGGDVLLNLGGLELGAIIDTTFGGNNASQTAIGGLVGLGLDLESVKLDLLGEAGGHRYGNFAKNTDIVTSSSSSEWLAYVGIRPGLTFKLSGPLFLGVWAFWRWDVTSHELPVTVGSANAASAGTYKLGGSTIGVTVRLGFDL
jgi:hypothetical protein